MIFHSYLKIINNRFLSIIFFYTDFQLFKKILCFHLFLIKENLYERSLRKKYPNFKRVIRIYRKKINLYNSPSFSLDLIHFIMNKFNISIFFTKNWHFRNSFTLSSNYVIYKNLLFPLFSYFIFKLDYLTILELKHLWYNIVK